MQIEERCTTDMIGSSKSLHLPFSQPNHRLQRRLLARILSVNLNRVFKVSLYLIRERNLKF